MMTKMSSMNPEGLLMAGGLGKDRRLMAGASSRMEKLLGNFPQSSNNNNNSSSGPAFNSNSASSDAGDLNEEEVWGAWPDGGSNHSLDSVKHENLRQKTETTLAVAAAAAAGVEQAGRARQRWLGLESGGLSVAFEEANVRSRFSPLTRTSNSFKVASPSRSMSVRMIPQDNGGGNGSGSNRHPMHQSAPVNVPDWSKILGMDHRKDNPMVLSAAGDEEEEEGSEEKLPPHEYLAREQARSQMTTTSVFEGVGRTLKGRDMSRVRNAVWMHTGFLG